MVFIVNALQMMIERFLYVCEVFVSLIRYSWIHIYHTKAGGAKRSIILPVDLHVWLWIICYASVTYDYGNLVNLWGVRSHDNKNVFSSC